MTPLQETQHYSCEDIFSDLPPELRMEILNQTPLQDIRHLISASPALLPMFQTYRASLLGHHLQDLLEFYGDESVLPFVAFTMDIRALRAQSQHLTASELEEKLKPALDSIQSEECIGQPPTGYLHLPILEKAQNLVPELCHAFHNHQERPYSSTPRPISHFLLEKASWQVKFTFIERFLRFDCYCNLFYYRTESLFSTSNDIKTKLRSPILHHPAIISVERFPSTIVATILHGCQMLLNLLDHYIRTRQPEPIDTPEKWNQDVLTMRRNGFVNRSAQQSQSIYFHLALGGFPLFAKLQCLKPEEFERYALEEFYQVVNAHPNPMEWSDRWTRDHDLSWE
ncbi:hypothetical protein F52700_4085 [Fusarium sp. NRRL 52700]|nr:hypothetical protein F52700_4085 [Fusarium sp. NRRL 52700]